MLPGLRRPRQAPECDEQMSLAGARIPDQAQRFALADPLSPLARVWIWAGLIAGLASRTAARRCPPGAGQSSLSSHSVMKVGLAWTSTMCTRSGPATSKRCGVMAGATCTLGPVATKSFSPTQKCTEPQTRTKVSGYGCR
jgi:hypothetical protein